MSEELLELELEQESYKNDPATYKVFHERYIWCAICGKPEIQAHHIVFGIGQRDTTMSNLCPLCVECHMRAHGQVVAGKTPIKIKEDEMGAGGAWVLYPNNPEDAMFLSLKPHHTSEDDGKKAHDLHTAIIRMKDQRERLNRLLGSAYKDMRDSELYKAYAPTMQSYFATPEIAEYGSLGFDLIEIAEQLEKFGIDDTDLDTHKLHKVLMGAKDRDEALRWIDQAQGLSHTDLNDGLAENGMMEETKYMKKKREKDNEDKNI